MLLETHFLFNGFFLVILPFSFLHGNGNGNQHRTIILLVYPQCRIALCFKMRWNKGLKALPDCGFLFIPFFRLFFIASVVFHCNSPPTHPEGHFMYICRWGECGLYFYSFRCCVRDMRTSHRLTALNVFFSASFLLQQTVWIDAFFFCVEKQCTSLFLLFFFLHVRRYAGHALNLTMFCCK